MLPLLIATLAAAHTQTFYISPTGQDAANGSKAHPWRTLEHARDALRQNHPTIPTTVLLQKGVYELQAPFRLDPQDSGTTQAPILYKGDHATLSGGQTLHGFQKDAHGWWTLTLPQVKSGQWRFSQLFVNGRRRYRPRLPKSGYHTIAAEAPPSPAAKGKGFDRFGYTPGDLNPAWHNLADVELLCFHIWDMSRMRIGALDEVSHTVTTTGPTGYDAGWANFPKGNRYIVENVREALSDPGEWYLDNQSGQLTYIPMPGEDIETATVVAPKIDRLIDIRGDLKNHRFVEHVDFQNLNLEYTNWNTPAQGRFFPQAEIDLGAAVHAEGWQHGNMDRCTISHTGEYGVEFTQGCNLDALKACTLTDLGAGGVKIGETVMHDDEKDDARCIQVINCRIAHGGRLHPAAIGVWIGQSSYDVVQQNRICDLYYTGVSLGWTWGYGKSQAHHNLIEGNDIFDIGQGILSDMGGIYTLGIQPGTRILGNHIHDVDSFSYGGWGIYPDEGSSQELIQGNVVSFTKSGGFHQHYGQDNVVTGNIFAFAREAEIIRTRAEDHLSFTFERNLVVWKNAPLLGSNWSGNNYKLDRNIYWRTDGKPIDFAGLTLAQWQAKGQDLHSKIIDPALILTPNQGVAPSKTTISLGFLPSYPPPPTFPPEPKTPPAFPTQKTG